MELLKDVFLKKGVKLKGLNSIKDGHEPIKIFASGSDYPDWFLCQWNSSFNLSDGVFLKGLDEYEIYDKSKYFKADGKKLIFELKAGKEFTGPRDKDEPWPHLLIEQEITENNRIRNLKKILCRADFSLTYLEDYMKDGKKDYHTVQFVWVVTFKDDNPSSPSYGSFIWVVMSPFDYRYEFAPLFMQQDTALPNGEFIYSFCGRDFMDKPLSVGSTARLELELYEKLPQILEQAQRNGFMKQSKLEDLVISSTNMGFEITGTFDCRIVVENLGIEVN